MIKRTDDEMNIEDAIRHNEEVERREAQEEAQHRQKSPQGKRKRREIKHVNSIPLTKEIWSIIVSCANLKGMKLHDYIAYVLEESINSGEFYKIIESNEFEVDILQLKTRRYRDRLEALEAEVARYNDHPTDDMAHYLIQQCDRLGVNFDDIIERTKDDPIRQAASEIRGDPDTKINQCCRWMIALMTTNNYRIAARQGNKSGVEQGFMRDYLKTARVRLNIKSIQDNGEWYWVWSESKKVARTILGNEDDFQST